MPRICFLATLIAVCLCGITAPVLAAKIQLMSLSTTGEPDNAASFYYHKNSVSADGRYVVFTSMATNLWPVDGNTGNPDFYGWDVFLRDRVRGTTELISMNESGEPGNGDSFNGYITADGRYVFFTTEATNLVDSYPAKRTYFVVRDRILGTTEYVRVENEGLWESGECVLHGIDATGRYILFTTSSNAIVAGDTNGCFDVFLRDRLAGFTQRVSLSSSGAEGNGASWTARMSAEARYIVFISDATNFGGPSHTGNRAYLRDRVAGATLPIEVSTTGLSGNGESYDVTISATGQDTLVASWADNLVSGDTNACADIFLRDWSLPLTERVNISTTGGQMTASPDIGNNFWVGGVSTDGRYCSFTATRSLFNPEDVSGDTTLYLRDRVANMTTVISGDRFTNQPLWATEPAMSAEGGVILFIAWSAPDFTPEAIGITGAQVVVWDRDASFHDVASCFWASAEIEACIAAGIVQGYPEDLYKPKRAVTRDQMAVYIARGLAGGDTGVPDGPVVPSFPDVPLDQWAYKYIEYCKAQQVVQGYDDGYHPSGQVKRDAMAVYIARSIAPPAERPDLPGYTPPDTPTFLDIPTSHWAFKYIEYCSFHGIVKGYEEGDYRPEVVVQRDQIAVYITRAFLGAP